MKHECKIDGFVFFSTSEFFEDVMNGRAVWFKEDFLDIECLREDLLKFKEACVWQFADLSEYENCELTIEEQKSGFLVYMGKVKEQTIEIELLNGETKLVQYSEIYKK